MQSSENYTSCGTTCEDSQNLIKIPKRANCSLVDVGSMGKYYLMKSTTFHQACPCVAQCHPSKNCFGSQPGGFDPTKVGIKRQYTDCFVMRQNIFKTILKIARSPHGSANEIEQLKSDIINGNSDDVCLSIKNYETLPGLSKFIHKDLSEAQYNSQMKPMFDANGLKIKLQCKQVF